MIGATARVTETVDASGAVREGVRDRLMAAGTQGFNVSQERVPVDRGTLLQSGVPPLETAEGTVVWGYNAEYARPVEEGTGPHHVPIDALRGWARRVLGDESLAGAVQEKIAEQGTEAQPYVQPGIDAMRAHLRAHGLKGAIRDNL